MLRYCPLHLSDHCINLDRPLRCASLASGHAARWAALAEAVADGFASVVFCGMERHETAKGKPCCTTITNDFDTTHPQQNEIDSAIDRVSYPSWELLFPVRTRACVACGARVGGSGQSSTLFFGLPWIAKASSHRRDTFLPLLHLIFEGRRSPGSLGAQPLFSADEKREHERSRSPASPVFVACGKHAGDTDQNSTVWTGVP